MSTVSNQQQNCKNDFYVSHVQSWKGVKVVALQLNCKEVVIEIVTLGN